MQVLELTSEATHLLLIPQSQVHASFVPSTPCPSHSAGCGGVRALSRSLLGTRSVENIVSLFDLLVVARPTEALRRRSGIVSVPPGETG